MENEQVPTPADQEQGFSIDEKDVLIDIEDVQMAMTVRC